MTTRRRVTYNQLESLLEILNSHRSMATGYNKTAQAREFSRRMWENVALNLNSHGEGAEKDWKGWNKYWNDLKSKLKIKLARAAQQRAAEGGPAEFEEDQLSDLEVKFLQILGTDFGANLQVTRVDPFEEVLLKTRPPSCTPPLPEPARESPETANSNPLRRRRCQIPRNTNHRRLRRRKMLPMDIAWRSVLDISQLRVIEDRRRNDLLESLLMEIRDVKDILVSRLPGLPSAAAEQT